MNEYTLSPYLTDTITLTNDDNTVTLTDTSLDSGFTLQGMTSSSGTVTIDGNEIPVL